MSRVVEASGARAITARAPRPFGLSRLRELVERESVYSWLMLTPPVLFLVAFLGYPFFYGVYLSFFRREVAGPATFVGLTNFVILGNDPIFWQSVGNTLFGYAAWAWLLARHPAATVSPMALLVPVFGMGASAWWLGEPLPGWKLGAAALVMAGLALNLFWPRWQALWCGRKLAP